MGLWNFLGGNKIGPGHPRYERELRKSQRLVRFYFDHICFRIMFYGMPNAIDSDASESDIIRVLKKYPKCPVVAMGGSASHIIGEDKEQIANWEQAQQWLKDKEFNEKDVKELQLIIAKEKKQIAALELEIEKMEQQIEKLETNKKLEKLNEK